jgi:hypothetical protein
MEILLWIVWIVMALEFYIRDGGRLQVTPGRPLQVAH